MFAPSTAPLAAAALALLAACGPAAGPAADAPCPDRASPAIGGPIALIDQDGRAVTEGDFKGRPSLVFFGFAYCPDICPNTLYALGSALRQLPPAAEAPRTILISVDPERDTPEALRAYVETNGFPDDTVGLTGEPEAIAAAARAFGAYFQSRRDEGGASGYLVDHSALVYLMDEDWGLATFFTPADSPETIAACIASRG
jgi:protein SCO1/2